MKIIKRIALALIVLSSASDFVNAQTLKERIDESKTVKVYFKNSPVSHSPNTTPPIGSNAPGTGCEKFGETTPLPQEYIDVLNGLIERLNTGFNTTAFVMGDFSAVPLKTDGIMKGEPDWEALGESLIFYVNTWGLYSVKAGSTGKVNSMAIESYLTVFGTKKDKFKIVEQEMLSSKWTEPISTQKCDDYAKFVELFPATSLVDPFKTAFIENTNELIAKDMKKYEKEMSKKK